MKTYKIFLLLLFLITPCFADIPSSEKEDLRKYTEESNALYSSLNVKQCSKICHIMEPYVTTWQMSLHGEKNDGPKVHCLVCHGDKTPKELPADISEFVKIDYTAHVTDEFKNIIELLEFYQKFSIETDLFSRYRQLKLIYELSKLYQQENEDWKVRGILWLLKGAIVNKARSLGVWNGPDNADMTILRQQLQEALEKLDKEPVTKIKISNSDCTFCHLDDITSIIRPDTKPHKYLKKDVEGKNVLYYIRQRIPVEHQIHTAKRGARIERYGKAKQSDRVLCQKCHIGMGHRMVINEDGDIKLPDGRIVENHVSARQDICFECHVPEIDKIRKENKYEPLNHGFIETMFDYEEQAKRMNADQIRFEMRIILGEEDHGISLEDLPPNPDLDDYQTKLKILMILHSARYTKVQQCGLCHD